jgi:hypothetical protein
VPIVERVVYRQVQVYLLPSHGQRVGHGHGANSVAARPERGVSVVAWIRNGGRRGVSRIGNRVGALEADDRWAPVLDASAKAQAFERCAAESIVGENIRCILCHPIEQLLAGNPVNSIRLERIPGGSASRRGGRNVCIGRNAGHVVRDYDPCVLQNLDESWRVGREPTAGHGVEIALGGVRSSDVEREAPLPREVGNDLPLPAMGGKITRIKPSVRHIAQPA